MRNGEKGADGSSRLVKVNRRETTTIPHASSIGVDSEYQMRMTKKTPVIPNEEVEGWTARRTMGWLLTRIRQH